MMWRSVLVTTISWAIKGAPRDSTSVSITEVVKLKFGRNDALNYERKSLVINKLTHICPVLADVGSGHRRRALLEPQLAHHRLKFAAVERLRPVRQGALRVG